jgi:transcriptional regulator with XRE-family HTH domain
MISAAQCRAARGLLGWTQYELAQRARVGIVTIHQVETGVTRPRRSTLDVIRRAFETGGAEFIAENGGGEGVRFRTPKAADTTKQLAGEVASAVDQASNNVEAVSTSTQEISASTGEISRQSQPSGRDLPLAKGAAAIVVGVDEQDA